MWRRGTKEASSIPFLDLSFISRFSFFFSLSLFLSPYFALVFSLPAMADPLSLLTLTREFNNHVAFHLSLLWEQYKRAAALMSEKLHWKEEEVTDRGTESRTGTKVEKYSCCSSESASEGKKKETGGKRRKRKVRQLWTVGRKALKSISFSLFYFFPFHFDECLRDDTDAFLPSVLTRLVYVQTAANELRSRSCTKSSVPATSLQIVGE